MGVASYDPTCPLRGKKIAVFGATGNIGRYIFKQLGLLGASHHAIVRSEYVFRDFSWGDPACPYFTVINDLRLLNSKMILPNLPELDGYVYCIGHCPTGGFDDEVSLPLSELPLNRLERDLNNHVLYLARVHQYLLDKELLARGASIVVIGSAITRLAEDTCPPWLNAWHYVAATAAKEALVRGMRHDPLAQELGLRIHYLAFGAVDTPFYEGCEHKPPKLLTIQQVTVEVIEALISDVVVHKHVLP